MWPFTGRRELIRDNASLNGELSKMRQERENLKQQANEWYNVYKQTRDEAQEIAGELDSEVEEVQRLKSANLQDLEAWRQERKELKSERDYWRQAYDRLYGKARKIKEERDWAQKHPQCKSCGHFLPTECRECRHKEAYEAMREAIENMGDDYGNF